MDTTFRIISYYSDGTPKELIRIRPGDAIDLSDNPELNTFITGTLNAQEENEIIPTGPLKYSEDEEGQPL